MQGKFKIFFRVSKSTACSEFLFPIPRIFFQEIEVLCQVSKVIEKAGFYMARRIRYTPHARSLAKGVSNFLCPHNPNILSSPKQTQVRAAVLFPTQGNRQSVNLCVANLLKNLSSNRKVRSMIRVRAVMFLSNQKRNLQILYAQYLS